MKPTEKNELVCPVTNSQTEENPYSIKLRNALNLISEDVREEIRKIVEEEAKVDSEHCGIPLDDEVRWNAFDCSNRIYKLLCPKCKSKKRHRGFDGEVFEDCPSCDEKGAYSGISPFRDIIESTFVPFFGRGAR